MWRLARRPFLAMVANPTGASAGAGGGGDATPLAAAAAQKGFGAVGLPDEVMDMVRVQLEHEVLLDRQRERERRQREQAEWLRAHQEHQQAAARDDSAL